MKIPFFIVFLLSFSLLEGTVEEKKEKNKRATIEFSSIAKTFVSGRMIMKDVYNLWTLFLREPSLSLKGALMRSKEHEMIGRIIAISSKISALEDQVGNIADNTIVTILEAFPKIIKLELKLHELQLILGQINFSEEKLRNYLIFGYKNVTNEGNDTTPKTEDSSASGLNSVNLVEEMSNRITKRNADPNWLLEKFTLQDYATWAVGHQYNSVSSLLNRMNNMITSDDTRSGIFQLITQISQYLVNCLRRRNGNSYSGRREKQKNTKQSGDTQKKIIYKWNVFHKANDLSFPPKFR